MSKTPDYIKKSVDRYRKEKEFVSLTLPKGTRERLEAVGVGQKEVAGFAKKLLLAELERLEDSRGIAKPPKQARTAIKTENPTIIPHATQKEPKNGKKEEGIPCRKIKVDVDGQIVELVLDQFDGIYDTHDGMQVEAFRRWRGSQMPKVPVGEMERVPLDDVEPMQTLEEIIAECLPDSIKDRIAVEGDS